LRVYSPKSKDVVRLRGSLPKEADVRTSFAQWLASTSVREKLDVWPLLPIVVEVYNGFDLRLVDNILAALEHTDRICGLTPQNFKFAIQKSIGSSAAAIPGTNKSADSAQR
jgi:hypothetical protein